MDTVSPALADAFGLLRTDLIAHLDTAEFLATKTEDWIDRDVDAARALIPDLVLVIRGLLREHGARADGECRLCGSAWPCPVVTTIHALVKDPANQFVALVRRALDDE